MKDLLFRCSRLSDLMTGLIWLTENQKQLLAKLSEKDKLSEPQAIEYGKLLEKKNSKELSESVKNFLVDIYLEYHYGYREEVFTSSMKKGLLLESQAITLTQQVLGGLRLKNKARKQNEYIIGTCDVVLANHIEDVKVCENLKTFFKADLSKDYMWQGQGYMWLWGIPNYRLIYTLFPDPEEMILDQEKSLYFKFGCNEENPDYKRLCYQIRKNNEIIEKMPLDDRIKIFEFQLEEEKIEQIKSQHQRAKEYLIHNFKL